MKTRIVFLLVASILLVSPLAATIFGTVRGIVHDTDHRPVPGTDVVLQSATSEYKQAGRTGANGEFEFAAVPVGEDRVSVTREGFESKTAAKFLALLELLSSSQFS
jgi:hypothetical protein